MVGYVGHTTSANNYIFTLAKVVQAKVVQLLVGENIIENKKWIRTFCRGQVD